MKARTLGAIALGPDNSQQVGYWFMNLNTGKRIHRRSWTSVPMPDEVIKRVEELGRKDGQPDLLIFTKKHGDNHLEDDFEDDDLSLEPEAEMPAESTGVPKAEDQSTGVETDYDEQDEDSVESDEDE